MRHSKLKHVLILTGLITIFLSTAVAYIGTAPGVQDLGTLEKGESYESRFYILTDRQNNFIVEPGFTGAHTEMLRKEDEARYDFKPSEASEEDISQWVSFTQEAYQVDPSEVNVIQLDNGGVARASQKITFNVDVPRGAEPGYHYGAVDLNPDFNPSGGGTSLQTVGLTQFVFVFKVPGKAERDLKILGVNAKRASEDRVRLDFLMKNNGTVTTTVQRAESKIYDQVGNKSGEVVVGGDRLAPEETRVVQTFWSDDNIEPGRYRVEGQMQYITGNSYIDDSVQVPEEITIQSSSSSSEEEQSGVSLWLIVMGLVVLGSIMYYFEISPVWIAGLIGLGVVSVLVLTTDLPDISVAVLLLLSLGIMVYRWI